MKRWMLWLMTAIFACGGMMTMLGCRSNYDLRVLTWRIEDSAYYDWMVGEFEKEYKVKVQFDAVETGSYPTILTSSLTGESVDVFQSQMSYYSNDNFFVYMQELSDMTDVIDKMEDSIVKSDKHVDGKPYLLSLNTTSEIVFYNKAIFRALNLSIPKTYPEFQSVMKTLSANVGQTVAGKKLVAPILYGGKDGWPVNMIFDTLEASIVRSVAPDFYVDVWKNGTKDFNDSLYVDLFQKMLDISKYMQQDALGLAYNRCPGLFSQGGYAMMIDGSWSYGEIMTANPDLELGAFAMPGNNDAQKNNVIPTKSGSAWSIRKGTEKMELAKQFLEFQFRDDVYRRYLEDTKFSSVLKEVKQEDPLVAEMFDYDSVLTFGDYIIPAMTFNMNTQIGPAVVGLRTTAKDACASLNEGCQTSKINWEKKLDEWLLRFHPEIADAAE